MADKKYIDADVDVSGHVTVWECNCSEFGKQTVMAVDDLYYLPAADVVEVVRCKDCKNYEPHGNGIAGMCKIPKNKGIRYAGDFCSYGVKEERTDG
jgi:hypothetical protein